MKITSVSILPVKKENRLKGYASVVFDDCLKVRNIRIIEDKDSSLFIVMPNRENTRVCGICKNKVSYRDKYCSQCGKELAVIRTAVKYKDVVFPLNKPFADEIEVAIVKKFKES
jgi:DNA-binding cell septation regulator SpoVG